MMAFVTGGASSGKSSFAEDLCTSLGGKLVYLAAMRPFGEEGERRIAKHRFMRAGKGFTTIECYEGLCCALRDGGVDGATVLLECLGNVVANEMFAAGESSAVREGRAVRNGIAAAISEISERSKHLVIVGNEVASNGCAYSYETVAYQRLLGDLSQLLAARSALVVECCGGVPVVLKQPESHDLEFLSIAGSRRFSKEAGA